MRIILLSILLFGMLACEDNYSSKEYEDLLIGAWSKMEYSDSTNTLKKTASLPDDEYGISFNSNGKLTEWKNSGWCGTPPISYAEFEGKWEFKNDSILSIESSFWGGTMKMDWKIISLDTKEFTHQVIDIETVYTEE